MARDYIPQNAAQFKEFMRNIIMYVEAHTGANSAWANIPMRIKSMTEEESQLTN
jgi:hypothetical protein